MKCPNCGHLFKVEEVKAFDAAAVKDGKYIMIRFIDGEGHRHLTMTVTPDYLRRIIAGFQAQLFSLSSGADIRAAREAAGLTRQELAALSGLSLSGLRNIEVGKAKPTAKTREKIGEVLKKV